MNKLWLIPITYALAITLEWLYSRWRKRPVFTVPDFLANIGSYAGYVLINPFVGFLMYSAYSAAHTYALFDFTPIWSAPWSWQFWVLALALFLLDDLTYYVFHRVSHATRFFWASHVTHHSSQHYNLSVGLRQSWTPFIVIPFWMPLPVPTLLGKRLWMWRFHPILHVWLTPTTDNPI